jgi:D-alanine-D-alanine ligase-like ATP-grasp enzyme
VAVKLGISKVEDPATLEQAIHTAQAYDPKIIVERVS